MVSWTTLAALALVIGGSARGQDAKGEGREDRALVERWRREVAEYSIVALTNPETTLSVKSEPALRWTNPVRNTDGGLVFLWLAGGRPQAVSCFYRVRWEGRLVEAHEFLSLAPVALSASRGGRNVWSPRGAGVVAKPVPGAAKPAASAAERLRQIRGLAREFRAFVDVEKGQTALRMLSQPAARYEAVPVAGARTERSADGALFAFVLTTDPEAWLVIDERPAEGEKGTANAWHYAFARMTSHSLAAKHRDQLVWEVARDPDDGFPGKPFCSLWDVGPKP